jgi:hypothetical protein
MMPIFVQRFIVDIVPELSFILRSAAFTARDHQERLEEFDRKVKQRGNFNKFKLYFQFSTISHTAQCPFCPGIIHHGRTPIAG